ncbi:MAG: hypothetical protein AAGA70_10460 [Pseudomonadota bacterium]
MNFAAIKNFAAAEDGAVTVDWVVLTAALVGLGIAVMAVVSDGVGDLSNSIADELEAQDPTVGVAPFTRTTP